MTASDKIVFSFWGEDLALDVDIVDSIVEVERFFRVPHSPPFLQGIITLHSEVVTVLDLPLLFHKERVEQHSPYRLVVARVKKVALGLSIGNTPISFLWKENIDDEQYGGEKGEEYSGGVIMAGEREIRMIDLSSLLHLVDSTINRGGLRTATSREERTVQ
ncbi:MAG: hypothetical protein GY721_05475 [Deltaproteobacteria bacterium]|nr:hypothetical protein [Deltaproteobacteria bacterium]